MIRNILLLGAVLILGGPLYGQKKGSLTVISEPAVEKLQNAYKEKVQARHNLEGYRVQIYNGKKSVCLDKRSEFLKLYPTVTPYTLYESPEYRIQVGDFRTRLEAEKFLREIIEAFPGSFILKTQIKWPELDKVDMEIEAEEG